MRRTHLSQLRRSIVAVMQSTDSRTRHDEAGTCRRSSTGGRSLLQSEMRSILVVVRDVFRKQPLQMPFVQRNHVIEEITSAAFHPTLSDAVLPRTLKRGPEGEIVSDRTAAGTSSPYFPSRSKSKNQRAEPKGNASRSCWTTQRLVGCFVTLKCRIRRRSWAMTKKQ